MKKISLFEVSYISTPKIFISNSYNTLFRLMLTKTLLALSLLTGTVVVTNPNQSFNPENKIDSSQTVAQLLTADVQTIAKNITVQVEVEQDRGSGILIAKNNNTYTVITNAHVTDRGDSYSIVTPDGIKHQATLVNSDSTPQNDLAILEFNSSNSYTVATIGNSNTITEGETVIAAGFPENEDNILVTDGLISLVTEKPLNKGYSIGFSNETVQGMSGGVLLNSNGEVVAILGKGQGAILDTAYDYIDGTTPTAQQIATYRESSFSIPVANIANLSPQLAALLPDNSNTSKVAQAPTSKSEYTGIVKTVDDMAQQITVRIATAEIPSYGSGVIIAREGNTYYVATAGHVLEDKKEYQIVTNDGVTHSLNNQTIIESDAYDFALFSFTSDKDYTVATIGNYNLATNERQVVFVSGFPKNQSPQRIITGGKAIEKDQTNFKTKDSYSLADAGQGLLYTNISYKGMSGGVVLDTEGRVVGINTGAENELYFDEEGNDGEFSLGYSLGIPISDIVGFLTAQTQFDTLLLQQNINPAAPISDKDYASLENQLFTVKKPDNETDLVAWMNYGNQLWRFEKPTEAVAAFEKVIEIDPKFHRAYYAMSLAYLSQEKYAQAITSLNQATHINPNPYFYWRYLGWNYSRVNQFENAFLAYEEAISKNAEDFVLYQEYGDVLDDAKQYNKAISSYNEALKLNPNHPWIYNNRGNVYYSLEQYDLALADYQKAIALNPQNTDSYNNIAIVYSDLEQYEKAIPNYNKAIALSPNYALAYSNRGATYHDMEKYDLALNDYQKAIDLEPENADNYHNRALTYAKLKQDDLALANYNKALEIAPNSANVYHNRGFLYDNLGQYDLALADYNQALTIDPNYAKTYNNRGLLYAALQEYDLALADYNQALTIDPNFTETYSNRGILYNILGESDLALADFNQAISLDPEYDVAYYNRGTQYNLLEKYDLALADFNQALTLNPQYVDAYINRGNAHRALEKYDLALADFNQALTINPQSPEGYLKRSGIYKDFKEYDLAIADLKQLIKLNPQNPQSYIFVALIYYELKDIPQTQKYFEQAGAIYQQQGNTEEYNRVQTVLKGLAEQQQ